MRLTRPVVLRAALDLLNEVGMDGLTTRRLADRLGVQSPTLYWHFKNKRDLFDAMAAEMLVENHDHPLPAPGEDWRDWLRGNAHSFRRALLAYRDGARIHAGTRPAPDQLDCVEAQLRMLCDADFGPSEALSILIALGRFVVGWVLEEQAELEAGGDGDNVSLKPSPAAQPLLTAALGQRDENSDAAFDHAIGLVVAGLSPTEHDPSLPV